jgi:hypothetical protein
MHWLIGRATPGDHTPARRAEMGAWLRSLGVDPTNMALYAAIEQRGEQYLLHLAELVLRDGRPFLNVAVDEIERRAVTVPVERDSWPTWLTGLNVPQLVVTTRAG